MLRKTMALAAMALVAAPAALAAEGGCHQLSGTSVTSIVPCPVPALACRWSVVTGDHGSTSMTVITTFDSLTGIYTGYRTGYLTNGAVIEASVVGWFAGGVGSSVATITGGTRQYEHATGSVFVELGGASGDTYVGEYCLGSGGKRD